MAGILDGYSDPAPPEITAPQIPDGWHPDGLLGGLDLGSAGSDIDAWANGTHFLSPLPSGIFSSSAPTAGLLAGVDTPPFDVGSIDMPKFDFYPDRLETDHALLGEPHVQALMETIRGREGPQYNVIHGGQTFDDYSQHPNIKVDGSTVAGAYQFNYPTWTDQKKVLDLPDFSPQSQDLAAVDLLRHLHATDRLFSDDVNGAIFNAGQRWQSLPTTAEQKADSNGRLRGINSPVAGKEALTNTLDEIKADYLKNMR